MEAIRHKAPTVSPTGRLIDWTLLNNKHRRIVDEVRLEWQALLDRSEREARYHNYVARHAGLFFGRGGKRPVVVSKLQMGSDLACDFVVGHDNNSLGFTYTLIELERPSDKTYNADGFPSAKLTHAYQQIQNWKYWLKERPQDARRLFPPKRARYANMDYLIVIGRRESDASWVHLRNRTALEWNVEIRSFDYLTDELAGAYFRGTPAVFSYEMDRLPLELANGLANPFYRAFSDSEWRRLVDSDEFYRQYHMLPNNARLILSASRYNEHVPRFLSLTPPRRTIPDNRTRPSHHISGTPD
jgi:hypothetical protein